jgi:hypothetical protein
MNSSRLQMKSHQMKRVFQILMIAFIVVSCQNNHPNGIYTLSHGKGSNNEHLFYSRTIFQFQDDSVSVFTFGNRASGNLGEELIEKNQFEFEDDQLIVNQNHFTPSKFENGFYLFPLDNPSDTLILTKLNLDLLEHNLAPVRFSGSYRIEAENYADSIDFISDTSFLFTSKKKKTKVQGWSLHYYENLQILNLHNTFFPLLLLDSVYDDRIVFRVFDQQDQKVVFTPNSSNLKIEQLSGDWLEIESSMIKGPPPPPGNDNLVGSRYYHRDLNITSSALNTCIMTINQMNRARKLNAKLSNDGSKIYFNESLGHPQYAWNLYELTDSTLTLGLYNWNDSKPEIIRFKRVPANLDID